MRVYLAGPDVFRPDPVAWGGRLKQICARHGLEGVYPLDPPPGGPIDPVNAAAIAAGNEAHIRSCRAVLANLVPFRGPSADAGTIYEVGFARGLGLPVFGYGMGEAAYLDRCRAAEVGLHRDRDGRWRDRQGFEIEDFGLAENLMIACAVRPGSPVAADLAEFERCVLAVVATLGPG